MNNLYFIRKNSGKTVPEIAEYLNISPQHYRRLENETRNMNKKYIEKLSIYFNVSPNDLLGYNKEDIEKIITSKEEIYKEIDFLIDKLKDLKKRI